MTEQAATQEPSAAELAAASAALEGKTPQEILQLGGAASTSRG